MTSQLIAYFGDTILSMTGGTVKGFALDIGPCARGALTRCYVGQKSGTLAGFTYSLHCRSEACPPGVAQTPTVTPGLYRVVPPLVVPSGSADYEAVLPWPTNGIDHLWQPFSTADDMRAGNAPDPNHQFLYLLINCAGTLIKTFEASLTFEIPIYT